MAEANWYWAEGDNRNGPVLPSAIARMVADGKLGPDDLIWKEGMADWISVGKVPALAKYIKPPAASSVAPPPLPGEPAANSAIATPGLAPADVASATVLTYQNAPVDRGAVHQFVADPNKPVVCPHCSAANTPGSQYCEACGMALPTPSSGPRIVDASSFASTVAGQQLQSEELHKQAKRAAGALLIVAIVQTVFGAIAVAAVAASSRAPSITQNPLFIMLSATALVFWGLYFWARKQPLPAAIVGLVLYVTLKVIDVVAAISQYNPNRPANTNGLGNSGISWINVVIIIVLAQAISAGLKHRKMQSGAINAAA